MANFNRVILLGNITRDIEVKYLQSGMAVTELGLAVNDRRKDQQSGQWVEDTTFVDITLWGRNAEVAGEYLSKGSPVLIEGRLKYDQWEKDGQKRSKLRVVGEKLQLLPTGQGKGGPRGGGGGGMRSGGDDGPPFDESEYGGGEPMSAPAPASRGPARQSAPPPPAGDDIPF
jgi:single-strand DNA-binding protein